jgi:hypothetical protein
MSIAFVFTSILAVASGSADVVSSLAAIAGNTATLIAASAAGIAASPAAIAAVVGNVVAFAVTTTAGFGCFCSAIFTTAASFIGNMVMLAAAISDAFGDAAVFVFAVAGGVAGFFGPAYAFIAGLSLAGFTSTGVTAGSWAAWCQGAAVAQGSWFAIFQAIGATGSLVVMVCGSPLIGIALLASALGASTLAVFLAGGG